MNKLVKQQIIDSNLPKDFKDWIYANEPKLRCQSVEAAMKGYIRTHMPKDDFAYLLSLNNKRFYDFILQVREAPAKYCAARPDFNFKIVAIYDQVEYDIYDISIIISDI